MCVLADIRDYRGLELHPEFAKHLVPKTRPGAGMLWARGSLTAAHHMHELARDCDPELRMVETLGWLLDSGMPQWAFRAARTDHVQNKD